MIKKFQEWSKINELSSQSATKPIENTGGEPTYNYGYIQDILGNKYNYSVNIDKLVEFELNVLRNDKTPNKNDDYFAKRFLEFKRNISKLTPPFHDDIITNNDYYVRSFYDETGSNAKNDTGKPIKGLQETILNEDGVAYAGGANVSGMGAVVSSTPSSIPGDVAGATTGSGDLSTGFNRNIIKRPENSRRKSKMKAKTKEMFKNISQFKSSMNKSKSTFKLKTFNDFNS